MLYNLAQSTLRPTIYWKLVIIFIVDVLHQFAQKASLINYRVRHITIYSITGCFFQDFNSSKHFDSLYSTVMPCILLWYGLGKSLQLHSEMSI